MRKVITAAARTAPAAARMSLSSGRALVEATGLLVLGGLNWAAAQATPSTVFSYTSLLLLLAALVVTLRISRTAAILALPVAFFKLTVVIGLILVEGGAEMPEMGRVGEPGAYSAAYSFYSAIFFLSLAGVFRVLRRGKEDAMEGVGSPAWTAVAPAAFWAMTLLCGAALAYVALRGLAVGFPLLVGADRFSYRAEHADALTTAIINLKPTIAVPLGLITAVSSTPRLLRVLAIAIAAAGLVVFVLWGDKFYTLINYSMFFCTPYLIQWRGSLGQAARRLWPIALAVLGLALSTTLYTYSGFGLKTKAAATEHFGDRSAEAGDTWFVAATESHPIFKYDHDMASDQLNAVVAENSAALAYDRAVGAFYFLLHYGRRDIATQFVDRKALTAFAGATEPIGLVMFGYAGLGLLMVGLASLWALLGVYLVSAVRNRSAVSAMFAAYLIASLFSGYVSGTLSVFVNRGFLKPGLVMLMIELAALGAAMAFRKGAGVRAPVAKTAAAKSPVAKPGPAVWRTGEARGRYSARSAR